MSLTLPGGATDVLRSANASASCPPARSTSAKSTRWAPLVPSGLRLIKYGLPVHLGQIEPLSVVAFTQAVARSPRGDLAVDVGSNHGAYSVFAAALGAEVLAIDMQPMCARDTACNLLANNMQERARVLLGYVTGNSAASPIAVPDDECESMASPSAVAGRWPHGAVQRKTRIIQGGDNRTNLLSPTMRLLPVRPLLLGEYIAREYSRCPDDRYACDRRRLPSISVVKIDTEGFEVRVLESLRPVWRSIREVILELQPLAWTHATVGADDGLRTLKELMVQRNFEAITLPHKAANDTADELGGWDACAAKPQPHRRSQNGDGPSPTRGAATAMRLGPDDLEIYVRNAMRRPNVAGWFSDVMLTGRCRAGQPAR